MGVTVFSGIDMVWNDAGERLHHSRDFILTSLNFILRALGGF